MYMYVIQIYKLSTLAHNFTNWNKFVQMPITEVKGEHLIIILA